MILLLAALCMAVGMIVTARAGVDAAGKPIGTDFLTFWSAARSYRHGGAYDLLYPPPFLLLLLPFGMLPYFPALALWLGVTGGGYWLVMREWLGGRADTARGAAMTVLAYPAVLINAGNGQNGFLTGALLGGGLWLLDRRSWVAGALLGMLVVKPQMALAVPFLVLASGRWRVMVAGAASAGMMCAASWMLLGPEAWTGFLAMTGTARGVLEQGTLQPGKMVSVFAAVQVLHGGVMLGYVLQGVVATGAAAVLVMVVRRDEVHPGGAAALCVTAGAVMSPYFLDYDLTVMAIPLAWLLVEELRRGFLPWEKAVLVAGFVLPLVARDLALFAGVPLGPVVMIALLFACARAAVWRADGGAIVY